MTYTFPENFWWGASSSAFQIEGGWNEDGKGMSVADYNSFKRSETQADSKVASDFYHHWEEDIALMQQLGLKAYRFSIAWSRMIPDGGGAVNQAGIHFYNQVIDRLLDSGIIPFVTLYHFDLPWALVEKYNGWASRQCVEDFVRYANVCFAAFGDRVKYWQVHNEQNLMIRVDERMNLREPDPVKREKLRAQMDYHMFLAHALTVHACHEKVQGGKIGCAVSSTVTYPYSNRPEDVWAAIQNNRFKTDYCLDVHCHGEYPGYYRSFLREQDRLPVTEPGDDAVLKSAKMDFIALNYYRTLTARYLPPDTEHPKGQRVEGFNEVDYDLYGYWKIERNENLAATEYGAQIDPTGLRIVLNDYWNRYHLPLIITENGLGTTDTVSEDGKIHDEYRIDYMRRHIEAIGQAISDGVEMLGYCPWSVIDLLSSHQGFRKRYGLVYVNRGEHDLMDLRRIPKDSFSWYQRVIASNGREM